MGISYDINRYHIFEFLDGIKIVLPLSQNKSMLSGGKLVRVPRIHFETEGVVLLTDIVIQ